MRRKSGEEGGVKLVMGLGGRETGICVDRVRIEGRREECNIHISP
jgi:hypothetical protein